MEFKYGDIVQILRRNEYGGRSELQYKVVDRTIDNGTDVYLLQDVEGKSLRGWHRANRLIKVESKNE